jgi:hypothetical protein
MFQTTIGKVMSIVLLFAATSNPILLKQKTVSTPSLAPLVSSLNCCDPNPTCQPDQTCVVSGTLKGL